MCAFLAKLVANIATTNHGKVGKEGKRNRISYLGSKGLSASISSGHDKREVGNNLKKLGLRMEKACYLRWRALGVRGTFL